MKITKKKITDKVRGHTNERRRETKKHTPTTKKKQISAFYTGLIYIGESQTTLFRFAFNYSIHKLKMKFHIIINNLNKLFRLHVRKMNIHFMYLNQKLQLAKAENENQLSFFLFLCTAFDFSFIFVRFFVVSGFVSFFFLFCYFFLRDDRAVCFDFAPFIPMIWHQWDLEVFPFQHLKLIVNHSN